MPSTRVTPRLDVALIALHPKLSRRQACAAIEKGQVTVDGATVREAGCRVAESSTIAWDPNRKALPRARLKLARLYEDEHVLIVDKPAGLLSVPAPASAEESALGAVTAYVQHLHPRRPFVGRVHRLDRETSGALAFALSPQARAGLIELFRRHDIERRYVALVSGVPRASEGTIDAPIRDEWRHGRRGVARPGEAAEPARTRWKIIERFAGTCLLEVTLETGRQHQVRAHLAHIGLSILGDAVYGAGSGPRGLAAARPMLHARRLAFRHPLGGQPVAAESPLPEDFAAALRWLRWSARSAPPLRRG